MMVNPLPRNYKQLFFVTNSIVTVPPDGKFVILLINSSDRSFEIKAERILAFLTPITPDIVLVLLNDSEKVTYDFKTVTPAYDNFVGFGQQRQDFQRNFVTPPTSQNQHLLQRQHQQDQGNIVAPRATQNHHLQGPGSFQQDYSQNHHHNLHESHHIPLQNIVNSVDNYINLPRTVNVTDNNLD